MINKEAQALAPPFTSCHLGQITHPLCSWDCSLIPGLMIIISSHCLCGIPNKISSTKGFGEVSYC